MNQREIDDYREAVTHGTCWTDGKQCNECTSLPMCNLTKKLLDAIEEQQQELTISKAAHADIMKSMSETIQQLQQEVKQRGKWIDTMAVKIERLQAQVAKTKAILLKIDPKWICGKVCVEIDKALAAIEGGTP
jgi:CTP-dependent riboflavin kinase